LADVDLPVDERVECINPSGSAVASTDERLILVDEPSRPVTPADRLDRTRRPAEVSTRHGCP
jgi:hypothetical protein